MNGVYRNESPPSLKGLKPPPRHLLKGKKYGILQAVQATRGCSNSCDFCSVAAFNHQTQRFRPVGDVLDEVRSMPESFFVFVDDNLTADRDYARDLFSALIPLKKNGLHSLPWLLRMIPVSCNLRPKPGASVCLWGWKHFPVKTWNRCIKPATRSNSIERRYCYSIPMASGWRRVAGDAPPAGETAGRRRPGWRGCAPRPLKHRLPAEDFLPR